MHRCICGREFERWGTLNSHFSRICIKKFNSAYDGWYNLYKNIFGDQVDSVIDDYANEKICCNDLDSWGVKLIQLSGLKRTQTQEKQTTRYKTKMESTLLDRYGVTNISKYVDVKQKKKDNIIKKYGSYENWASFQSHLMIDALQNIKEKEPERWDEIRESMKDGVRKKYDVNNVMQIPEIARKMSESQKLRLANLSIEDRRKLTEKARANIKRDWESSIEIRVQQALTHLEIFFEKHKYIGNRNYDIVIHPNIIIEVNGDYWHANPLIYNETDTFYNSYTAKDIWEKDEYKKKLANKHGYNVISLWESDINSKSEEDLILFIEQEINNVYSDSSN